MTTEEIVRVINNSYIRSLSEFIGKSQQLFPEISNVVILDKVDLGLNGILSTGRFYNGTDEIIVKGFLYLTDNWTPDTHGYVIAKNI